MIARGDPWSREQIARRRRLKLIGEQEGFAARAEDVIIGKLIYFQEGGSEKHLRDIASMMKMNRSKIDEEYLDRWVEALGLTEEWQAVLRRLDAR